MDEAFVQSRKHSGAARSVRLTPIHPANDLRRMREILGRNQDIDVDRGAHRGVAVQRASESVAFQRQGTNTGIPAHRELPP